MHRPTLVLRRFDDLGFGLGYYEDGSWVDHASPAARVRLTPPSLADQAALDAIHTWFDCCVETAVAIRVADAPTLAASARR